ncbi:MAG: AraC family transcriptional regulator [Myxococcota bacterium]
MGEAWPKFDPVAPLAPPPEITEFHSDELERVREFLGHHFTEHLLRVQGQVQSVETVLRAVSVGDVSVNYVEFAEPVEIEQTVPEEIFMVGRPLRGELEVRNGSDYISGGPPRGAVLSMNRPNYIRGFTPDLQFRVVRLEREPLERQLSAWLGRELQDPVRFEFPLPADSDAGRAWWGYVEHLWANALNGTFAVSPLLLAEASRMTKAMLLSLQVNNYTAALREGASAAAPFYVRRAEDYMHAHTGEVIGMEDLVAVSGVSARSLYAGFRRFRGTSPMAYLKWLRLDRAHTDLRNASPGETSVREIALCHGFAHLGHFSTAYRRKYGQPPSETLRTAYRD